MNLGKHLAGIRGVRTLVSLPLGGHGSRSLIWRLCRKWFPCHHPQFIQADKDWLARSLLSSPIQLTLAVGNGFSAWGGKKKRCVNVELSTYTKTNNPRPPPTSAKVPSPGWLCVVESQVCLIPSRPPPWAQKRLDKSHFPLFKNMGLKLSNIKQHLSYSWGKRHLMREEKESNGRENKGKLRVRKATETERVQVRGRREIGTAAGLEWQHRPEEGGGSGDSMSSASFLHEGLKNGERPPRKRLDITSLSGFPEGPPRACADDASGGSQVPLCRWCRLSVKRIQDKFRD